MKTDIYFRGLYYYMVFNKHENFEAMEFLLFVGYRSPTRRSRCEMDTNMPLIVMLTLKVI